MDFIDISKRRVTTRRFAPIPVEKEKLDKILEAGRWAPTAVNAQPQRVLVLNTAECLEKVREFCTFNYNPKYAELDSPATTRLTANAFTTTARLLCCWFAMIKRSAGSIPKAESQAASPTRQLFQPT